MTLLNGGLQAVFGTAFAALFDDGVLHKVTLTDDGQGGFTASIVDLPVKVQVDSASDRNRIAGGLPRMAVNLTVLTAGLTSGITLDDSLTVKGLAYRVVQVDTDPAGTSLTLVAIPT